MLANMHFSLLYYDIISPKSLQIAQVFHLLLGFAKNQIVFWDFKIQNSIQLVKTTHSLFLHGSVKCSHNNGTALIEMHDKTQYIVIKEQHQSQ